MMNVKRFEMDKDYDRVISFLTDCYKENKNIIFTWENIW